MQGSDKTEIMKFHKKRIENPAGNKVPYCIAGFGGAPTAALASSFRPTGQERLPEIRYSNMHQPLAAILKKTVQ